MRAQPPPANFPGVAWLRLPCVPFLKATKTADYDDMIAHAWPAVGFEVLSSAPFPCSPTTPPAMQHGDPGWPYYDDILWWALAMLRAADMHSARGGAAGRAEAAALTSRAAAIFDHVAGRAWNATAASCGGGIWWSTARSYKNAIANELFLTTAAQLGRVVLAWA